MNTALFVIPHSKVNHWSYNLLFITSVVASIAMLGLLVYALWVNTPHKVVMIIFLLLVSGIFAFVARFIWSFGKNYIAGIKIYKQEIAIYYPQKKKVPLLHILSASRG